VAGLDTNRGAKRAREAREALGLDAGAPLECVLRAVERRCDIVVCTLPDGVAGAYAGGVVWVHGGEFVRRQRFTLAHEFGHAWIGHDAALAVDTIATLSGRTTNPLEVQANAFAAEFLVPRAGVTGRLDGEPTLEDVVRLAALYGVSAPMMLVRFRQVGIGSPERIARLQREVDAGEHVTLFGFLGLEPIDDALERIERLPYLSPRLRGSLLDAVVHGDAAASPELAGALDRIMRPARP
jgi:hypothetical protein